MWSISPHIVWTDQIALESKDFWTEEHSTIQNNFFLQWQISKSVWSSAYFILYYKVLNKQVHMSYKAEIHWYQGLEHFPVCTVNSCNELFSWVPLPMVEIESSRERTHSKLCRPDRKFTIAICKCKCSFKSLIAFVLHVPTSLPKYAKIYMIHS